MRKRREIEKLWQFVEGTLNSEEVQLLYLYSKKQLRKQEIARMLNLDPSTLSYRLERGVKKLRYEYLVTKVLPQIEEVLPYEHFKTFMFYLQTKNQEQVASSLGMTQSAVSQRLSKIKDILRKIRRVEMREFVKLLDLKLDFWGYRNEKKLFINSRIVRGEK